VAEEEMIYENEKCRHNRGSMGRGAEIGHHGHGNNAHGRSNATDFERDSPPESVNYPERKEAHGKLSK
jgi:hypothetical protein